MLYLAKTNAAKSALENSCEQILREEASFDFNASGGDSGLKFDGATFANSRSRKATRHSVKRMMVQPEREFGSIDETAGGDCDGTLHRLPSGELTLSRDCLEKIIPRAGDYSYCLIIASQRR
jgi:hypothetical protein